MIKKIYLAGYDVFELDGVNILNNQKNICKKYGFKAITPIDKEIELNQDINIIRQKIFEQNINYIKDSDMVIANMNNFRHGEPDSGTVFEIGFAYALGKNVYIYSDDNRTLVEKTMEFDNESKEVKKDLFVDKNNLIIENFNEHFNLMISESTTFVNGSLEDVLKIIRDKE